MPVLSLISSESFLRCTVAFPPHCQLDWTQCAELRGAVEPLLPGLKEGLHLLSTVIHWVCSTQWHRFYSLMTRLGPQNRTAFHFNIYFCVAALFFNIFFVFFNFGFTLPALHALSAPARSETFGTGVRNSSQNCVWEHLGASAFPVVTQVTFHVKLSSWASPACLWRQYPWITAEVAGEALDSLNS